MTNKEIFAKFFAWHLRQTVAGNTVTLDKNGVIISFAFGGQTPYSFSDIVEELFNN